LYTFSTETWNRPDEEVNGLMNLMVDAIERETPAMMANGIRMYVMGDLARLPVALQEKIDWCMQTTAVCNGMNLVLAVSYSSRWEIVEAVRALAMDVEKKGLKPELINERLFETYLKMHEFSDPDLLIRTGGELRLSNFLLWQLAYAELYFTEIPWPEFREEAFYEAIHSFQTRERRFGKISDQIQPKE
jgi:undecaprenyl diphosphate synthase